MLPLEFKKFMAMTPVPIFDFCLSNFEIVQCRLLNLKKSRVDLSNVRVKGPTRIPQVDYGITMLRHNIGIQNL